MVCNINFDSDKEREFCMRDLPSTMNDWDIFDIFEQYGLVDNVRIPSNQGDRVRYSFITMINLTGADAVREAIVNGRLRIGDLALRVNEVGKGGIVKPQKSARGKKEGNRAKGHDQQKKKISYLTTDLPLGQQCDVRVVPSPFPVSLKKGLTFHVLNLANSPSEEYTKLHKELNEYCKSNKNTINDVEIGEPVIFCSDHIGYRAMRTGKKTVYLVDVGREETIVQKSLFRMQERFTVLPTLVIECSLANVAWLRKSVELFHHIRNVTFKWCETEGPLKATLHSFNGTTNMISLSGSGTTDLKKSLVKRGDVKVIKERGPLSYDRKVMETIHQQVTANPAAYPVKISYAEGILVAETVKSIDEAMKGLAI